MYNQAYFAGGCFWCTESIFRIVKGVTKIIPGYMGGHLKNPVYSEVCNGNTGHTEAIKITYDQDLVTYGDLLEIFFLTHDPTTPDRQGNDVGSQYKSAIFFNNFEEKIQIENFIKESKDFDTKVGLAVRVDKFSDSSIDMYVRCFTQTDSWNEWLKVKERLAIGIKEIVEKNKASFAFPSQSIYVEKK